MSITIKDILSLKAFKEAKLLTNSETTSRIVQSVSVSDTPIHEELIKDNIFCKGDFYLSTLNLYKDDFASLKDALRIMIKANVSGLCITDEYFDGLPSDIVKLCNNNGFPIIQIDKDIPYSIIIREITETIISNQSYLIKVNTVNELLHAGHTGSDKLSLIRRLNSDFQHYFRAFYINDIHSIHDNTFINSINDNKYWFCIPYLHGILAILSFKESKYDRIDKKYDEHTHYFVQQAKNLGDPVIGISSKHEGIINIDQSIRESMFATRSSPYTSTKVLHYDQLGSIRLLIALQDHKELINYYDLTIKKLLDYDKSYNLFLLDTIRQFVKHNGDYKQTARELNQHENTIRYRINKAKTILDLEDNTIGFYETISLSLKVYDIINK